MFKPPSPGIVITIASMKPQQTKHVNILLKIVFIDFVDWRLSFLFQSMLLNTHPC